MSFQGLPKQPGRRGGAGARRLTARQTVMLAWIVAYIARENRSPLIIEIAAAHGIRASSAWGYLDSMNTKGAIVWGGKYRSVRPADVVA